MLFIDDEPALVDLAKQMLERLDKNQRLGWALNYLACEAYCIFGEFMYDAVRLIQNTNS